MKTSKIVIGSAALGMIAMLSITGCKKKDKNEEQPDTQTAYVQDHNIAETHNNDIGNIGTEAGETYTVSNYRLDGNMLVGSIESAPCATVTINLTAKQFTVDFGTTPCLCKDGRYRSGKLLYDYSASTNGAIYPRQPGFSITCTSQNYVVDGYTVNIINRTHTNITPPGFNPATTKLKWQVTANINVVKPNNGGTISWTCSRTTELDNTSDTTVYHPSGNYPIKWNKAILRLNGTASGTSANGTAFSVSLNNLIWSAQCTPDPLRPFRHPFISGTVTFTPGNKPARVIDYGNGSCDFAATVCIPAYNYCTNITLP
jgi:hypothetical protein